MRFPSPCRCAPLLRLQGRGTWKGPHDSWKGPQGPTVLPTVVTAVDAAAEGGASWGRAEVPVGCQRPGVRAGLLGPRVGLPPSGAWLSPLRQEGTACGRLSVRPTCRGPGRGWCPQARSPADGSRPTRVPRSSADPSKRPSRQSGGSRTPPDPQPRAALPPLDHGCLALPGCAVLTHKPPAPPGLAKSLTAGHWTGFQGLRQPGPNRKRDGL